MPKLTRFVVLISLLLLPFAANAQYFKDFSEKIRSVDEFTGNGKWTVVMLWASDCHVCNHEAHEYVDFHQRHKDNDAQVLGISLDGKASRADAEKFISRHKLNFPNLIGEPEAVASFFQNLTGSRWIGTPTFLFFSPQGELMAQQVGAVPPKMIESFIDQNKPAGS